jgi:hypothetical protein
MMPGQRQVLAGKRSPRQVRLPWQLCRRQTPNISDPQLFTEPERSAVRCRFGSIDVVGKQTVPSQTKPNPSHASTREKLVKRAAFASPRHRNHRFIPFEKQF